MNGMSTTTSARDAPRRTAAPWWIICSTVTGTVESSPRITFASESPTRIMSAPPSSDRRANSASYADTMTSRSPRCFLARTSRTVTRGASPPLLIVTLRERGAQLGELALPELAIRQPRMRQHERRRVHDAIAEEYDIEVEGP